jgi:hypothetical protein
LADLRAFEGLEEQIGLVNEEIMRTATMINELEKWNIGWLLGINFIYIRVIG